MTKEKTTNQDKAEQMNESIAQWLEDGAPGAELVEKECFGTVQQDLAIGFAQELLDSVGLPVNPLFQIARSLSEAPKVKLHLVASDCVH